MTERVHWDATGLSYLDPPHFIAARHDKLTMSGIAELDPRKEFDVVFADFTRMNRTFPKSIITEHAKREYFADTASSRKTGEHYAQTSHTATSAAHDAPAMFSCTVSRKDRTSDSGAPLARQNRVHLTDISDESMRAQVFDMLQKNASPRTCTLGTLKMTGTADLPKTETGLVRSNPYR